MEASLAAARLQTCQNQTNCFLSMILAVHLKLLGVERRFGTHVWRQERLGYDTYTYVALRPIGPKLPNQMAKSKRPRVLRLSYRYAAKWTKKKQKNKPFAFFPQYFEILLKYWWKHAMGVCFCFILHTYNVTLMLNVISE